MIDLGDGQSCLLNAHSVIDEVKFDSVIGALKLEKRRSLCSSLLMIGHSR